MGQKEVKNKNCCGVFEMRDMGRNFSEVLNVDTGIRANPRDPCNPCSIAFLPITEI